MQVVCFMNKKLMKKMYFWFIGAPITFWATWIPVSLVAYLVQPYVKKKIKKSFHSPVLFLGVCCAPDCANVYSSRCTLLLILTVHNSNGWKCAAILIFFHRFNICLIDLISNLIVNWDCISAKCFSNATCYMDQIKGSLNVTGQQESIYRKKKSFQSCKHIL